MGIGLSTIENLAKTKLSILGHIASKYRPAVLATAFGPETMAMIDPRTRHELNIQILSIETGRPPEVAYALIQHTRRRYGRPFQQLLPEPAEISGWIEANGLDAFYDNVINWLTCCRARKVTPLKRGLARTKARGTGPQRSRSCSRKGVAMQRWEEGHGLYKFNPTYDWTRGEALAYIHRYPPIMNFTTRGIPRSTAPHVHEQPAAAKKNARVDGGGGSRPPRSAAFSSIPGRGG